MHRIPVVIEAGDPISRLGMDGQLRTRPEVRLLTPAEADEAAVVVVVVDTLTEREISDLRRLHRRVSAKLVLVPTEIDDAGMSAAVECGVIGVVRRTEASADRLVH